MATLVMAFGSLRIRALQAFPLMAASCTSNRTCWDRVATFRRRDRDYGQPVHLGVCRVSLTRRSWCAAAASTGVLWVGKGESGAHGGPIRKSPSPPYCPRPALASIDPCTWRTVATNHTEAFRIDF
jgi:hypothetical protein